MSGSAMANSCVELEKPGRVETTNGFLLLDVPAGATVWFRPEMNGPIRIEYDATMVQRGGPNDRVSDLNCFWMATNVHPRAGRFAEYNDLRAHYVGQGGNGNTTMRFRRYIGDPELRPLPLREGRDARAERRAEDRTDRLRWPHPVCEQRTRHL
jgi:hypothetical protein